ncbi:MAG: hypothetical protein Q8922_00580 [Bacteroidota bacterium]|nr:hypothetical protein [Bacteroidota bacterium]MDP4286409.1 hypothetical protein [Bacteroidota bacterium]
MRTERKHPVTGSLKFYGITAGCLLLGAALSLIGISKVHAQNVFRVRIDTITAKAGDTVTVNVNYQFTATHSHMLNGYVARFLYDTNLIWIASYVTDSTATAGFISEVSHRGISIWPDSHEIDLTNPVLFRMRVVLRATLSDTAWIRWDSSFALFDPSTGVDSTIQQDGWVRTSTDEGHTILTSPGASIAGYSNGYVADSVKFDLPVTVTDLSRANVQKARFGFVYDPSRLIFESASSNTNSDQILATTQSWDTVSILIGGRNGNPVLGGDTLAVLHFVALVGIDTECMMLGNLSWHPVNADAHIGTCVFDFDSICLFGHYLVSGVTEKPSLMALQVYPSLARDFVNVTGFENLMIRVYDPLGRCTDEERIVDGMWRIPSFLPNGIYVIVVRETGGIEESARIVVER